MSHYLPTSAADERYSHGGATRTPYRWRHADETARLAETVTHYDIGMISWQYDDNSTWILQEETVPTWIKLSISATAGGGTLNTIVKWTPDGYSLGDSNISDDGSIVEIAVDTTVDGTITANDVYAPFFAGGFTGAFGRGGLGISIGGNANDPLVSFDVVDAAKSTLRNGVIYVNNSLGKLTINNGLTDLDFIVLGSSGAELIKIDSALGETSFVLGDAAGARKVYVKDSGLIDVSSIDSDGNAWFGGTLQVDGNATIGKGVAGVDPTFTFDGETNDCSVTWEQAQKRLTVDQEIYENERPLLRYAFMMGMN